MKAEIAEQVSGRGIAPAGPLDELPIAYIELNAEGVIQRANRAASRLFETDDGSMVGKTPWDFMAVDEIRDSRENFFSFMKSNQDPPTIRRPLYTRSGQFRIYENYRSLIRDEKGAPIGMRYVAIDVTEAVAVFEEASNTRTWLSCVLKSIREAVLVVDSLGVVRYVNPAMEELCGWKADEMLGKAVEKCFPIASQVTSQLFDHSVALERPCDFAATILNSRNEPLRVEIRTAPLIEEANDCTLGFTATMRRLSCPEIQGEAEKPE